MFGISKMKFSCLFTLFLQFLQIASGDVKATLKYHVKDGIRPSLYGYRREGIKEGVLDASGTTTDKDVTIINGRPLAITLASHSFEMGQCETSLKTEEFYEEDQRKIKEIYYKEMEECVKQKLGADFVLAFNHQVRNKDRNNGGLNNIATSIQGYAKGIHSDTHPETSDTSFLYLGFYMGKGLDWRYYSGRYVYLNLWRSIDDDQPIVDDHLAVLDQTSLTEGVGSEDYIESDYHGHEPKMDMKYTIKQFVLNERNSDKHRWYYFPNMTKSEVIFFKQWDSDPKQLTNMCFHTAFEDPTAPKGTPPRQSIEVRFMVYFPDHKPDTCPSKWKVILGMAGTLLVSTFSREHPLAFKGLAACGVAIIAYLVYLFARCCANRASSKSGKND